MIIRVQLPNDALVIDDAVDVKIRFSRTSDPECDVEYEIDDHCVVLVAGDDAVLLS